MKTIWAIESGSYSNYHIVGVFSTREGAQLVLDFIKDSEAEIVEWELDPGVEGIRNGLQLFQVLMRRNGDVESIQLLSNRYIESGAFVYRRSQAPACKGMNLEDVMNAHIWGKDAEQAIKAANEKRVQFIATGEWE